MGWDDFRYSSSRVLTTAEVYYPFLPQETEDETGKGTWHEVIQAVSGRLVIQNRDDGLCIQGSLHMPLVLI